MNNQIQLVLKSSTAEMPLNDQALGIYLTPELDGLVGLPEIRTTSGVNAGYDGGWTSAQNYDARSITIRGVIANENVATVERLRKQLVSLAGQGKSEELTLDLVTEAGNAYTLQVRTIALEMSMQSVLTQQQFMLQLRADDPLIYDAGESEHEATLQVAQATGGFTIDFELPLAITGGSEESVVNNDGLEEVPTIVKMYGALHNPKIINQTNNEQMQIMADLGYAEGAWDTPSEASEGTSISLTNTQDSAPFSDIKLKGDTAQNGTPTPSAPVAVQTVTGENVVKICGKNLFDKNNANVLNAYFALPSDTTITSNALNRTLYVPCDANTTYTFQAMASNWGRQVGYTQDTPAIGVSVYGITNLNANATSVSITTGASARYLVFRFWHQNNSTETYQQALDSIQIELGNQATTYEPYQGQSYEVNLNAPNLYDKTQAVKTGSSNQNVSFTTTVDTSTHYVFDCGTRSLVTAYLYNSSDTQTRTIGGVSDSHRAEFTTTSAEVKVQLVFYVGADVPLPSVDFSMVNFYKPSDTIELCKIGDYQDYIYKSGDKWYKHEEVGKVTLNGSETYGTRTNTSTTHSKFRITNNVLPSAIAGTATLICSNFVANSGANTQSYSDNAICGSTASGFQQQLWFSIENSIANTASAFQTWVTNNTPTVYYAEATPTDTEITNEALVAQLDDLLNLSRTYQGQTNLSDLAASGNMPAILNVSYFTEQDPDTRDELIIDSRLHTVTLNGLDIYHLIGEGSEFLMLEPGENRLSLQSDITGDNGYAVVSYKQGYLSI